MINVIKQFRSSYGATIEQEKKFLSNSLCVAMIIISVMDKSQISDTRDNYSITYWYPDQVMSDPEFNILKKYMHHEAMP